MKVLEKEVSRVGSVLRFLGPLSILALLLSPPCLNGANGGPKPGYEVHYTNEVIPERPWSIHVVAIERGHND